MDVEHEVENRLQIARNVVQIPKEGDRLNLFFQTWRTLRAELVIEGRITFFYLLRDLLLWNMVPVPEQK